MVSTGNISVAVTNSFQLRSVSNELGRIWKEAAAAQFEIISWNLSGNSKQKSLKSRSSFSRDLNLGLLEH